MGTYTRTGKKIDWHSSENESFLNPRFAPRVASELVELLVKASDEFKGHLFVMSSGTSSGGEEASGSKRAKPLAWVALSKEAMLASAAAVNGHLESDRNDVWLNVLPEFHVGSLGIWARSALSGASVVKLSKWEAKAFVAKVCSSGVTLASLVPTQVYDLVAGNFSCPDSLRAVVVGGSALSYSLYHRACALGWPLLPSYGMTESCSQVATAPLGLTPKSSLPLLKILPHVEIKVTPEGNFRIKGSSLLTAYIYEKEGRSVISDPKVDGWLNVEDRGMVTENDFLIVYGRTQDSFKIGGESVELGRLREILEDIRIHHRVNTDVDLLPVPDERLGHVIHLVSDQNLAEEDARILMNHFNKSVLPFERVREWNAMKRVPRTSLGKLIPTEAQRLISN